MDSVKPKVAKPKKRERNEVVKRLNKSVAQVKADAKKQNVNVLKRDQKVNEFAPLQVKFWRAPISATVRTV